MDDATHAIELLANKLRELDNKVASFRAAQATEFFRYQFDLLRPLPRDVSAEIEQAIAETLQKYTFLGIQDVSDDDDDMIADAAADVSTPAAATSATDAPVAKEPVKKESKSKSVAPASSGPHSPEKVAENRRELGLVPENYRPEEKEVKSKEPVGESESLVPKAAHDAR